MKECIDNKLKFGYTIHMEILATSSPLAVRALGSQLKTSPAELQLLQQTRASALLVTRPERKLPAAITAPASATEPIGKNMEVIRQQSFEFRLSVITGAFSQFVISILGLNPTTPISSGAMKVVEDSSSKLIPTTPTQPFLPVKQSASTPIPNNTLPPINQTFTRELIQPSPTITSDVHVELAQATVVQPLTQAQHVQVSPALERIAEVTKVSPYMALEQQKGYRLNIFDTSITRQNHASNPRESSNNRLDMTA